MGPSRPRTGDSGDGQTSRRLRVGWVGEMAGPDQGLTGRTSGRTR